jgi:hypothetical protein
MRSLRLLSIPCLLLLSVVGCGFSPGPAEGEVATGATSGTGNSGSGGSTTVGTGGPGLSGGGAGTTGSGTGGMMSCGQTNVPIMPLPPDILIIEDRSGSMNDDDTDTMCAGGCGATSKWALITAALNNVASQTDTTVNWGLKFFADADAVCGVNSPGVAVPIAPMSSAAIATAITGATAANGGVTNGSRTPTAKAVTAGVAYLQTLTDPNPKYLLLATDGLPNCAAGNNNNTADDSAGAEAAVAAALTAGFETFVVGIATTADAMATATLNAMATNGGQAQTGAATMYYAVADTASLETALGKIVGIVANCTISLAGAPTNFTNVAISATDSTGKKVEVMQDPTNGWAYDASKKNIVLNGTACDSLKNGSYSDLNFIYSGCAICIDRDAAGHCVAAN